MLSSDWKKEKNIFTMLDLECGGGCESNCGKEVCAEVVAGNRELTLMSSIWNATVSVILNMHRIVLSFTTV